MVQTCLVNHYPFGLGNTVVVNVVQAVVIHGTDMLS